MLPLSTKGNSCLRYIGSCIRYLLSKGELQNESDQLLYCLMLDPSAVYTLFTICGIQIFSNRFIFQPQEGFMEVGKIYRYHAVQYHVSLLTYEHYTIV